MQPINTKPTNKSYYEHTLSGVQATDKNDEGEI